MTVRETHGNFYIKVPPTWEVVEHEDGGTVEEITLYRRETDGAIVMLTVLKEIGGLPIDQYMREKDLSIDGLLRHVGESFRGEGQLESEISRERITQFAGNDGVGNIEHDKVNWHETSMLLEMVVFLPGTDTELAGCAVIAVSMNDREGKAMQQMSSILRSIRIKKVPPTTTKK